MSIEEIRGRLEAATPGPWTRDDYVDVDEDGTYDLANVVAPDSFEPDDVVQAVVMGILRPDAEFIAAAPEDMRRLLNAVEGVLAHGVDRENYTNTGNAEVDAAIRSYAYHVRRAITSALEAEP